MPKNVNPPEARGGFRCQRGNLDGQSEGRERAVSREKKIVCREGHNNRMVPKRGNGPSAEKDYAELRVRGPKTVSAWEGKVREGGRDKARGGRPGRAVLK